MIMIIFIHPNIENQEGYLEDLVERFIEGLNSKDSVFHNATEHIIKRTISYLQDYSNNTTFDIVSLFIIFRTSILSLC